MSFRNEKPKVRLATSWGAIVFSFKFDFDLNFVLKILFIHIGLKSMPSINLILCLVLVKKFVVVVETKYSVKL